MRLCAKMRYLITLYVFWVRKQVGGAMGSRTPDLYNAIVALYQLSYDPSTTLYIKDSDLSSICVTVGHKRGMRHI